MSLTTIAQHRPAVAAHRFQHDAYSCLDLFSGFGGLSRGMENAGFAVIYAANHNEYKVEIHEANHPGAEHWIADLVDETKPSYHDVRDLPYADVVVAGVSCVNHSQANTQKAYAEGKTLFDLDDPDYDARVTRSERDRATANCVLHYAQKHHPKMMLIECTTELQCWGPRVPGKKYGDGSTFRWWLREHTNLGYRYKILYLNSMFFGVPQSRDRLYIAFWLERIPAPDLEHRPISWCGHCDTQVEAVWTWRTGIPPTGSVRYGKQYDYRCPSCRHAVVPPFAPSLHALDLSDLGTRIGDRKRPLAASTMARAERCRQRFAEFPAILMPCKAERGSERHPWQPMATQTSRQETAILSTGAVIKAAGNTYEHPGSTCRTRGLDKTLWAQSATNETALLAPPVGIAVHNYQGAARGLRDALPTQGGSETLSLLSTGVLPYRRHTTPTTHVEAMPTVTADQTPALLTAAGVIKNNGNISEAKYRSHPVSDPLGAITSEPAQAMLFGGWYKQNGSIGNETAAHPFIDPFGTLTSRDTTGLLAAKWRAALADIKLEDCYFRMLFDREIGRGCGFDVPFGDYKGTFIVWGSPRDRVDGYGNAVSPPVSEWVGLRMMSALHGQLIPAAAREDQP